LSSSIGGVGENQPTSSISNDKNMHMHATVIDFLVTTHSSIATTSLIKLEIQ
jgi:hypothetical protein